MLSSAAEDSQQSKKLNIGDNTISLEEVRKLNNQKILDNKKPEKSGLQIIKIQFSSKNGQKISLGRNDKVDNNALRKIKKDELDKQINHNELEYAKSEELTITEKDEILKQAKETKEGFRRKQLEKVVAEKVRIEKENRSKEIKQKQKQKKLDIVKRFKDNLSTKKNAQNKIVSIDEVYELGEEATSIGIEIIPPSKYGQKPTVKLDENKVVQSESEQTSVFG
jgi:hypothetical protein